MLPKKPNCCCPEKEEQSHNKPTAKPKCTKKGEAKALEENQKEQTKLQIPDIFRKFNTINQTESQQVRTLIIDLKNHPRGKICCEKQRCKENSVNTPSFLELFEKYQCCPKKMCKLAAQICEIYKPFVDQRCLTENVGNFGQGKYHFLLKDASTSYTDIKELRKAMSVKIVDEVEEVEEPEVKEPEVVEPAVISTKSEDADSIYVVPPETTNKYSDMLLELHKQHEEIDKADIDQKPMDISGNESSLKSENNFAIQEESEKPTFSDHSLEIGSLYNIDQDSLEDVARDATEKAAMFRNVQSADQKKLSMFNEAESKPSNKKFRLSEPGDNLFKRSQLDLPTTVQKEKRMSKFLKSFKGKSPKKGKKYKLSSEDEGSAEELDKYSKPSSARDATRSSHIEDPVAAKQQELNNILSNM